MPNDNEWQNAGSFSPELSALDLWRVDLDKHYDGSIHLLSLSEQQRSRRFCNSDLARRWINSRFALRSILSHYLSTNSGSIHFTTSQSGKPSLTNERSKGEKPQIEFNLSHSADCCLIGIAFGAPVGVDLEKIDPAIDIFGVAESVFSVDELSLLRSRISGEAIVQFYEIWTKKEAWLKMLGWGLIENIADFSVLLTGTKPVEDSTVTIANVDVQDNFMAAYSIGHKMELVRMFDFVP